MGDDGLVWLPEDQFQAELKGRSGFDGSQDLIARHP